MLLSGFTRFDLMSDEERQAEKDRLERAGPRPKSETIVVALFFTTIAAIAVAEFSIAILPDVIGHTWRGMATLAAAAAIAGGLVFWARDYKHFWYFGVLEIAVGMATATTVVSEKASSIVIFIGFIGASRLIADGVARLWRRLPAPEPMVTS